MAYSGRTTPHELHHSDEGVQVKRSVTGTLKMETGNSRFYSKSGIMTISEGDSEFHDNNLPLATKVHRIYEGNVKFPKLEECAHFHYDFVEMGKIEVTLVTDQENIPRANDDLMSAQWMLIVTVNDKVSMVRRSYKDFVVFDQQLHRCIYDRRFSQLPELKRDDIRILGLTKLMKHMSSYVGRFSQISGNMINCGPVLSWLELDNRGNRLIVMDDTAAINIPAVAAAHVTKRYVAQAPDEVSLEVGDIVSIIMMPPVEETNWWRGKKVYEVGFFPSNCVEVIGGTEKLPMTVTSKVSVAVPKPVANKHGKLIAFLRNFFSTRPSRTDLKRSGIVRERIFGCDLGEHLLNSDHPEDVPALLKQCADFIETQAIVDGIYRLSGSASNIQKLRNEFDAGGRPDLTSEEYMQDVHCVSSLIKMYFRELPNPLFTYQLYDKFIEAFRDEEHRLMKIYDVIQQLPPPHYRTAKYLLGHLSRMAEHSKQTNMHTKNLAIVWAPNLIRPKQVTGTVYSVTALQDVSTQAVVTEFLITYAELVFANNVPPSNSGQSSRPKSIAFGLSTNSNLISLDEAREKFLGSQNRPSSVSGTIERQLTSSGYHTVIERPIRKKQPDRKSIFSIFGRNRGSSKDLDETVDSKRSSVELVHTHNIVSDQQNIAGRDVHSDLYKIPSDRLRTVHSVESLAAVSQSLERSASVTNDASNNPQTIVNPYADEFASIRPRSATMQHPKYTKRSMSADYNSRLYNSLDNRILNSSQVEIRPRLGSSMLNNLAYHARIVEELEKRSESRSSISRASARTPEESFSAQSFEQPYDRHSIAICSLPQNDFIEDTGQLSFNNRPRVDIGSLPSCDRRSTTSNSFHQNQIPSSSYIDKSPVNFQLELDSPPNTVDDDLQLAKSRRAQYHRSDPALYQPTPFQLPSGIFNYDLEVNQFISHPQRRGDMHYDNTQIESSKNSRQSINDSNRYHGMKNDTRSIRISQSVPTEVISSFLLADSNESCDSTHYPSAMTTFHAAPSLSQENHDNFGISSKNFASQHSPNREIQKDNISFKDKSKHNKLENSELLLNFDNCQLYGSLEDLRPLNISTDDELCTSSDNFVQLRPRRHQYDNVVLLNRGSVYSQYENVVLPIESTKRSKRNEYDNVMVEGNRYSCNENEMDIRQGYNKRDEAAIISGNNINNNSNGKDSRASAICLDSSISYQLREADCLTCDTLCASIDQYSEKRESPQILNNKSSNTSSSNNSSAAVIARNTDLLNSYGHHSEKNSVSPMHSPSKAGSDSVSRSLNTEYLPNEIASNELEKKLMNTFGTRPSELKTSRGTRSLILTDSPLSTASVSPISPSQDSKTSGKIRSEEIASRNMSNSPTVANFTAQPISTSMTQPVSSLMTQLVSSPMTRPVSSPMTQLVSPNSIEYNTYEGDLLPVTSVVPPPRQFVLDSGFSRGSSFCRETDIDADILADPNQNIIGATETDSNVDNVFSSFSFPANNMDWRLPRLLTNNSSDDVFLSSLGDQTTAHFDQINEMTHEPFSIASRKDEKWSDNIAGAIPSPKNASDSSPKALHVDIIENTEEAVVQAQQNKVKIKHASPPLLMAAIKEEYKGQKQPIIKPSNISMKPSIVQRSTGAAENYTPQRSIGTVENSTLEESTHTPSWSDNQIKNTASLSPTSKLSPSELNYQITNSVTNVEIENNTSFADKRKRFENFGLASNINRTDSINLGNNARKSDCNASISTTNPNTSATHTEDSVFSTSLPVSNLVSHVGQDDAKASKKSVRDLSQRFEGIPGQSQRSSSFQRGKSVALSDINELSAPENLEKQKVKNSLILDADLTHEAKPSSKTKPAVMSKSYYAVV